MNALLHQQPGSQAKDSKVIAANFIAREYRKEEFMILNKGHFEEMKKFLEETSRDEYSDGGLRKVNNELLYEAMRSYERKDGEKLKIILQSGTRYQRLFESSVTQSGRNVNVLLSYAMGEFTGILKVLERLTTFMFGKEKKRQTLSDLCASRRHVKQILLQIYDHSDIRHGELAEGLGIGPNYLSELIKLLEPTGSINRYAYGKSTYYELSLEGQRYVEENLKEPDEDSAQLYLPKSGKIPMGNPQLLLLDKNCRGNYQKEPEKTGKDVNGTKVLYFKNFNIPKMRQRG